MRTLIHHSPAGALTIAGLIAPIEPGEPFDVDDDALAQSLLTQTELFTEAVLVEGVPLEKLKAAELRTHAAELELDVPAKATKAQLIALISAAPNVPVLGGPAVDEAAPTDPAPAADTEGDQQ